MGQPWLDRPVGARRSGNWTAWTTKPLTASLNAGGNTIRLEPTTADNLPNIDHLDVGIAAW